MDSSSDRGTLEMKVVLNSDADLIAFARKAVHAKEGAMTFDELQTWLCTQCQECCKWITIQTHLKDVHPQMEFYKFYVEGRGLTMMKTKTRGIMLSVPHICPHLIQGVGCDIYETRPQSCRNYDGRMDFLLKDKCKWNLLDEILREEDDENEQGSEETAE